MSQYYISFGIITIALDIIENLQISHSAAWIGVTNIVGGVWKNIDNGSNVTYFNWAPGEPQNNTYPLCVRIKTDGLWYSGPCYDWWSAYLCSVPGSGETGSKK